MKLGQPFFLGESVSEHHGGMKGKPLPSGIVADPCLISFRDDEERYCVDISLAGTLKTSYFVGMDWVAKDKAIYVEPKLFGSERRTHYVRMLDSVLVSGELIPEINALVDIKWDLPMIPVPRQQDLLTPLLTAHFLSLLHRIVRKGLKKSYYTKQEDLVSRIKGKVHVTETIRKHAVKNRLLRTTCSHDEHGINGAENRLLKKALVFVSRYQPAWQHGLSPKMQGLISYISAAFVEVSSVISDREVEHTHFNVFFAEYREALQLARMILRRFGFKITEAEPLTKTMLPPFWIDMSKLFELYALRLLKQRFGRDVYYHFSARYNELDFLVRIPIRPLVVDAKYRLRYLKGSHTEDMRQVSGYARLQKVYVRVGKTYPESIDCLVIYPDPENGLENLVGANLFAKKIDGYEGIYKVGVKIPVV